MRASAAKDWLRYAGLVPAVIEYFQFWVVEERTGKRALTAYKLSRADAARAFPGAEADLTSCEVRDVARPGDTPANSRPGKTWA